MNRSEHYPRISLVEAIAANVVKSDTTQDQYDNMSEIIGRPNFIPHIGEYWTLHHSAIERIVRKISILELEKAVLLAKIMELKGEIDEPL